MRFSLRETKIELFTKCHFLTSDKVFALHEAGPLRVNQKISKIWSRARRSKLILGEKGGVGFKGS